MTKTQEALEQFHRYAVDRLAEGQTGDDLDGLLQSWYDEQERDAIGERIRRGLIEIDAGQGRPAREVSEELRIKYGLSRG